MSSGSYPESLEKELETHRLFKLYFLPNRAIVMLSQNRPLSTSLRRVTNFSLGMTVCQHTSRTEYSAYRFIILRFTFTGQCH